MRSKLIVVIIILSLAIIGCAGYDEIDDNVEFLVLENDYEIEQNEYFTMYTIKTYIETESEGMFDLIVKVEKDGGKVNEKLLKNPYRLITVVDGVGTITEFDFGNNEDESYSKPVFTYQVISYDEYIDY